MKTNYIAKYIKAFALSHLISAYFVVMLFLTHLSGYGKADLERVYRIAGSVTLIAIFIFSLVLYKLLKPIKAALDMTSPVKSLPEPVYAKAIKVFRNFRMYMLTFNLIAYPLVAAISIAISYFTKGYVMPHQIVAGISSFCFSLALTVFQGIIFNSISIKVKKTLKIYSIGNEKVKSIQREIFASFLLFFLFFNSVGIIDSWRVNTKVSMHYQDAVKEILLNSPGKEDIMQQLTELRSSGAQISQNEWQSSIVFSCIGFLICMAGVYYYSAEIKSHIDLSRRKLQEITSNTDTSSGKVYITSLNDIGALNHSINQLIERNKHLFYTISNKSKTLQISSSELISIFKRLSDNSKNMRVKAKHIKSASEKIVRDSDNVLSITSKTVTDVSTIRETVNKLIIAAQEITKVTDIVSVISGKTNLLAVNASIEATRAGESGKGFAVVAGEVRNLALQTDSATQEIREKVSGIHEFSNEIGLQMERITEVIDQVSAHVASIAMSVMKQSDPEKEQTNVQQEAKAQDTQAIINEIHASDQIAAHIYHDSLEVNKKAEDLSRLANQLNILLQKHHE